MEDGEEEARVIRMAKLVAAPSAEEVRQHNLFLCRYRIWCPVSVCVRETEREFGVVGTFCVSPSVLLHKLFSDSVRMLDERRHICRGFACAACGSLRCAIPVGGA